MVRAGDLIWIALINASVMQAGDYRGVGEQAKQLHEVNDAAEFSLD